MNWEGPVLGDAIGQYWERTPSAPLRSHFSRVWFNRIPAHSTATAVIVPDGCMDLQWMDGALRIAGPDATPQREALPPGTCIVGFRFQAAAAPSWLRTRACELRDLRVPLEAFWGRESRRMVERAGEADTPEEIARRLERELAARAMRLDPGNWAGARLFHILNAESSEVADACAVLGLSPRTLRRRCHDWFGYSPRTLVGILRFQRFLRAAQHARAGSLADLAAYAGYADQPHLTREARRLAGLTPAAIVAQVSR